jgi:hypothetical protein
MEKISLENRNKDFIGHEEHISIDDETEDEEVKLNCIGGLRGYQDSDFSSDSGEEEEQDEGDDMEEEKQRYVVVWFGLHHRSVSINDENLNLFDLRLTKQGGRPS